MTAAALELSLPLPPSVNHSHRPARAISKTGKPYLRRVPTDETKAWRSEAYFNARRAVVCTNWQPIIRGKVVVELTYYWPDRRRRDTHNRIKEIMDLLQTAGIFADDCQALARELDYLIDRKHPRVDLSIWELWS